MRQVQGVAKHIRGWFPQEPIFIKQENLGQDKFKVFAHRMATAIVVGGSAAGLLGLVGSLLGFKEGVWMYVWTFATVMLINAGIGVYAKYTLRKLGLPAGTKPW